MTAETAELLIWPGIVLCLMQSALFSGLNLALLGLSRLQLEVEAKSGSKDALKILDLRQDSHFLLTTVLWGNVSVNCLLTLLSDSVMAGAGAFMFSTIGITIVGEIFPQAYFSRNAMRIGALLTPFIRLYQKILYPVAKPSALLLDRWLGSEEVSYFRERELREVIRQHMLAPDADLEKREGLGALNFLVMDDLPMREEGEPIHPASVLELPLALDLPVFPPFGTSPDDPFLRKVQESGHKWVVVTDTNANPRLVLDADGFLREAVFAAAPPDPYQYCHRPIIVTDGTTPLGRVVRQLRVEPENVDDDVIDQDLVLLWGEERRIMTGADLLGRLLRGIVSRRAPTEKARCPIPAPAS
jgi:CBS domain containing-hemolysin-like protein